MIRPITFLLCILSPVPMAIGANQTSPEAPTARLAPSNLQWWQDARFGMFIHWGPVSLKGTEIGWSRGKEVPAAEYDELYRSFNPVAFDANQWVALARESGMRYLVFTAKHHDGFCMWNTAFNDYNIMNSPFGRDVVQELAKACADQGIRFCTYFSILDWWNADYPLGSPGGKTRKLNPNMPRYRKNLKGQLDELITQHGPLGILWFDGEWESPWTEEMGRDLYQYCRTLQPSIIVNNRVGKARQGMEGTSKENTFAGDYDTPEQRVGMFQDTRPWESCITICQQWAWKPNDKMKSLQDCIRTLVTCAGGNGNLLLNVGPTAEGRIEPRQAARLREMGQWLKAYGASIYGTRGGPFRPGKWGVSTRTPDGKTVYVHLFDPPQDKPILLPALGSRIEGCQVLTGGKATVSQSDQATELMVSPLDNSGIDTIVKLTLDQLR